MEFSWLSVFGSLSGLGVFVAALAFAFTQLKLGTEKAKDNLIDTYKEQLALEKQKMTNLLLEKETIVQSHQKQLTELTSQVGILQGKYEQSEKQKSEYLLILQGRNPENEAFMKFIMEVAQSSAEYMKTSSDILKEIHKSLVTDNKIKPRRKEKSHATN